LLVGPVVGWSIGHDEVPPEPELLDPLLDPLPDPVLDPLEVPQLDAVTETLLAALKFVLSVE
jgi:hypothetical protein